MEIKKYEQIKRFYRPEIDGLRFTAFLMIFLDHTLISLIDEKSLFFPFYNSGFLNFGVDLFFILSSFLITKLLILEYNTYRTIDIKSFLIRRSLRIYPLYFLTLLLCIVILPIFFKHPSVYEFGTKAYFENVIDKNLIPHLFFFANNTIRFTGGINQYFSHLWTISIEEQFYIVWPFILFYFLLNSTKRSLVYFLGYSLLFMIIMRYYHVAFLKSPHPVVYMGTSTRMDGFAIGAIIAIKSESIYRNRVLPWQLAMGLLVLGIYFLLPNPFTSILNENVYTYTFIALGFGLILDYLVSIEENIFNKILGNKVLSYLGKISYGLYIFHIPVFLIIQKIDFSHFDRFNAQVISIIVHFLITLAISIVSYNILEKPFLKLKKVFEKIETRKL